MKRRQSTELVNGGSEGGGGPAVAGTADKRPEELLPDRLTKLRYVFCLIEEWFTEFLTVSVLATCNMLLFQHCLSSSE